MPLDEHVFFARLNKVSGRHFDNEALDAFKLATLEAHIPTDAEMDEMLVYLSRYSRTPMPYFEGLTFPRVFALFQATSKLIAAENGKRPSLDPGGGEETR